MSDLLTFKSNYLKRITAQGYTPGTPFSCITRYQQDKGSPVVSRLFIASSSAPDYPDPTVSPYIWYNETDGVFYKSTNWKSGLSWEAQTDVNSLFIEDVSGNDGTFNGGNVTVPVYLVGPATAPNQPTTLEQVQFLLSTVSSGGGVSIGDPVQDLTELAALDVSILPDKHLRYVENERDIYAYDSTGTAAVDGRWCVKPLIGPGRWTPTQPKIIDSGTF